MCIKFCRLKLAHNHQNVGRQVGSYINRRATSSEFLLARRVLPFSTHSCRRLYGPPITCPIDSGLTQPCSTLQGALFRLTGRLTNSHDCEQSRSHSRKPPTMSRGNAYSNLTVQRWEVASNVAQARYLRLTNGTESPQTSPSVSSLVCSCLQLVGLYSSVGLPTWRRT